MLALYEMQLDLLYNCNFKNNGTEIINMFSLILVKFSFWPGLIGNNCTLNIDSRMFKIVPVWDIPRLLAWLEID